VGFLICAVGLKFINTRRGLAKIFFYKGCAMRDRYDRTGIEYHVIVYINKIYRVQPS
jgi:hypothetical protein